MRQYYYTLVNECLDNPEDFADGSYGDVVEGAIRILEERLKILKKARKAKKSVKHVQQD